MTYAQTPSWADTTCLLCGAPSPAAESAAESAGRGGHYPHCPSLDPQATAYLTEQLPDGTVRSWTLAGARYTATEARRTAIAALMPGMVWVSAAGVMWLPATVGWLIEDVVPQMGVARWLAQVGYNPSAGIRVPDCGCTDALRCRCDVDGHPHTRAHPDLWADCSLAALRLRRNMGWQDLWLLDIGVGAVVIANDVRDNDPVPARASRSCQMGWCDHCDATRLAGRPPTTQPCTHTCHTTPATAPPDDTDQASALADAAGAIPAAPPAPAAPAGGPACTVERRPPAERG